MTWLHCTSVDCTVTLDIAVVALAFSDSVCYYKTLFVFISIYMHEHS